MNTAESPLPSGTRLGPYEIVALVGSGGMAEVYRAHDTRLNRVVAIKVLGANVADTPQRRQRFEREARAVSALSHPNICVLYDVGEDEGRPFLVMEFVAGETLAQRLRRGPLSVADALRLAILIADALDHAHRQGIVHRDLKPANVILTSAGPKLVDFGLAKLRETEHEHTTVTDDTESLTSDGMLLGTLPYMAPEQVEAKHADARSDIFAFGSMLYEILTARRAFDAESKAGLIVSILEHDPPALGSTAHLNVLGHNGTLVTHLEHLVGRCLAKQPDDRWQTAADLKRELRWISERVATMPVESSSSRHANTIVSALSIALIVVTLVLSVFGVRRQVPLASTPSVATFPLTLAPGTVLVSGPSAPQMAVSPDGQWIAYTAGPSSVASQLWLWRVSDGQLRPLEHTDGADYPFWSPDSQSIGFFAFGRLKITRLDDKAPIDLAPAVIGDSGAWGADDTILFASIADGALQRVSTRTRKVEAATHLDLTHHERRHGWPSFLPDGRRFLYFVQGADDAGTGIALASIDAVPDRSHLIMNTDARAAYARGSIIFGREGTLFAQPFDSAREVLAGKPEKIVTNVAVNPRNGRMAFSITDSILIYRTGSKGGETPTQLQWRGPHGEFMSDVGEPALYGGLSLSPDGQFIAVSRGDPPELQLFGQPAGVRQLLGNVRVNGNPAWSSKGDAILVALGSGEFVRKDIRTGEPRTVFRDPATPDLTSWSPDGRTVLYSVASSVTNWDIWEASVESGTPHPYLATRFTEGHAQFSPDGHWVVYVSDESGRREIWVNTYPVSDTKYKISEGGGYLPLWRADGRALYYLDRTSQLIQVDVQTGPTSFIQGRSHTLFQGEVNQGLAQHFANQYAVSPDGQRFLFRHQVQPDSPIMVMLNWPAAIVR